MVAGLAGGLALSPFVAVAGGPLRPLLVLLFTAVLTARRRRSGVVAAIALLFAAALAGLFLGHLRLAAIDRSALAPSAARERAELTLAGFVEAEPTRARGVIRFRFSTGAGRLMVEAPDPGPKHLPGAGDGLEIEGPARPAPDWYRPTMERQGLKVVLRAERITPTDARRRGPSGLIDRIRDRAERALGRGMPEREAALARGFVLGQDAAIDDRTVAAFRGSGLSHLLAVSGQNVVLLGLLAWPVLALLGAGPQARRVWTVLLILTYIPLAGGGASIQRAGVMGIAMLAAAGAGRAGSRLWAVVLAAAVTLGLDPRASLDPGWQLSFAAVVGIALAATPLRIRFEGFTGSGGWRRTLAEGAAVTVAASLATAPLIAFHFGRLAVGTVIANLMVLPAVAPAMWLGMIAAAVGQLWTGLAVPFNLLNSVILAAIAQVAAWLGRSSWSQLELQPDAFGLLAATLGLAAGAAALFRLWRPPPADPAGTGLRHRRRRAGVALAVVVAVLLALLPFLSQGDRRRLAPPPPGGVRIELLDVGQGDAILIRPSGVDPVLIDGGPPDGDLPGALASAGVTRLAAVLLTHRHLDHFGGLFDLFPGIGVDRFLFDAAPSGLVAAARSSGADTVRVAAGTRIGLGAGAELDLLWPPVGDRPPGADDDPNVRSVGALLRWKGFRMYLPGDGEAEAVPVDPGPLDLLKVAHHGSADAGLSSLLARDRPSIAVIGVGEGNGFGHPTPETLRTLAESGVRVYRTDRDGTVSIVLGRGGYRIETGR